MNDTTATCTHCKKEVAPDHTGPCPYCGKVGKNITINVPTVAIGVGVGTGRAVGTVVRRQLDENERRLWDKLLLFFKANIIVDGFEVGFPSGIKVIFKFKGAQE